MFFLLMLPVVPDVYGDTALEILTESLPEGTACMEYTSQSAPEIIGAELGEITWSAQGLPEGLSINPESGIISGIPPAPMNYTIAITATANGASTTKEVSLKIVPGLATNIRWDGTTLRWNPPLPNQGYNFLLYLYQVTEEGDVHYESNMQTAANYYKAEYEFNVGGAMEKAGYGTYYVEVRASYVTNTFSVNGKWAQSPLYYYYPVLENPENVTWNGDVLSWNGVENARGYLLQYYQNDEPVGEEILVGSTVTSYDFTEELKNSDFATNCHVKIKAKGAPAEYIDSDWVQSGIRRITRKLPTPTNLRWIGTELHWDMDWGDFDPLEDCCFYVYTNNTYPITKNVSNYYIDMAEIFKAGGSGSYYITVYAYDSWYNTYWERSSTAVLDQRVPFHSVYTSSEHEEWGTVSISGNGAYQRGNVLTVTHEAADGYELRSLSVLTREETPQTVEVTKQEDGTYSFVMPDASVTVTPYFRPRGETFTVTISENENGEGSRVESFSGGTYTFPRYVGSVQVGSVMTGWNFEGTIYQPGETIEHLYRSFSIYAEWDFQSAGQNPEGIYEIGNGYQLLWFAKHVKAGNPDADAILLQDITVVPNWSLPIGTEEVPYEGTFDGGGHTISELKVQATAGDSGLFGYLENAVVKDLTVDGTMTIHCSETDQHNFGLIGYAAGTSTISGIESGMDITVTDTLSKKYIGGIAGRTNDAVTLQNCVYTGTMNLGEANADCAGGIVGYTGAGYTISISNSAFYGEIISDSATAFNVGGILGYYNGDATHGVNLSIRNCLSAGTLTVTAAEKTGTIMGVLKNVKEDYAENLSGLYDWTEMEENAFGEKPGEYIPESTAVTEAELKNGRAAYLLGKDWGQNLDNGELVQELPVPGGAPVYKSGEIYSNRLSEEGFGIIRLSEDKKTATVVVPEEGTYHVVFADYNQDGVLAGIDVQPIAFEAGSREVTTTLTLNTGDVILLWQDLTGGTPLCPGYLLK